MKVRREVVQVPGLTPHTQCRRLAGLAAEVPAGQVIVEIGVYKGRTACWLAAGAQAGNGAHVYGVDPWGMAGQDAYDNTPGKRRRYTNQANMGRAIEAVRRCGLQGRVTLMQGFSTQVAAHQWHEAQPIGLHYIDGDHREAAAYNDFTAWAVHMAADAVVCWDDYNPERFPGVVAAVGRLLGEGHVEKVDQHDRLLITRRIP